MPCAGVQAPPLLGPRSRKPFPKSNLPLHPCSVASTSLITARASPFDGLGWTPLLWEASPETDAKTAEPISSRFGADSCEPGEPCINWGSRPPTREAAFFDGGHVPVRSKVARVRLLSAHDERVHSPPRCCRLQNYFGHL